MLEMGVIKPSKSPWASPIVLVGKPEVGEISFCIDYRKLNSVTVKDTHPLPLIEPIFALGVLGDPNGPEIQA